MPPADRPLLALGILAVMLGSAATIAGFFNEGIEPEDLKSNSVSNCVTGVKVSLSLLDSEWDDSVLYELGELSPRCNETEIYRELREQIPSLLDELERRSGNPQGEQ